MERDPEESGVTIEVFYHFDYSMPGKATGGHKETFKNADWEVDETGTLYVNGPSGEVEAAYAAGVWLIVRKL